MNVMIRLGVEHDYDQVEQIMKQVQKLHTEWRPDIYVDVDPVLPKEMFLDDLSRQEVIVAEVDEQIVGIIIYTTRNISGGPMKPRKVLFIDSMAVDEEYRGKGIGQKLFDYVKNIYVEHNYDGLELQVNARNHAAKAMYDKYGFTEKSINMEFCAWDEAEKAADIGDIDEIYELCKKLIDTYENIDNIDYEKVLRWVRLKIENSIDEYCCILHEGKKVGYYHFIQNEDGTYELDDLYVFDEYQNQGIGTKVIKKCCSKADGPVYLYVFIKNERAVSLYKKLGFRIIETIQNSRYIMRWDRQPEVIQITDILRLKKYDGHYEKALPGYQDPFVYQNSEGIFDENKIPDMNYVKGMCQYLNQAGELYFIEVLKDDQYISIGDVTVKPENPPIAIWFAEYRGKGIGTLVMQKVIDRLKELGYQRITDSTVYKWNECSLKMHQKLGFKLVEEKEDEYVLERVL